jgi:hypothetical protein
MTHSKSFADGHVSPDQSPSEMFEARKAIERSYDLLVDRSGWPATPSAWQELIGSAIAAE